MLRYLRRIAVAFVGGIVVAVGVAMLVLPGPAVLVIPAGLAILATEFHWARRLLHRIRITVEAVVTSFKGRPPVTHTDKPVASSSELPRVS
jgi:tellurite resistance protein TerC